MRYKVIFLAILIGFSLLLPAMNVSATDTAHSTNTMVEIEGTITNVNYSGGMVEITVMTQDGSETYKIILSPMKLFKDVVFKIGSSIDMSGWIRNGKFLPTVVKISNMTIEIRYKKENGEIERVKLKECKDKSCRIIIRRNVERKCERCEIKDEEMEKNMSKNEGDNTSMSQDRNETSEDQNDSCDNQEQGENHSGDHDGNDGGNDNGNHHGKNH